jgi:hypothetical protein
MVQPPIQNNERDAFLLAVNNYVAGDMGLFDAASGNGRIIKETISQIVLTIEAHEHGFSLKLSRLKCNASKD